MLNTADLCRTSRLHDFTKIPSFWKLQVTIEPFELSDHCWPHFYKNRCDGLNIDFILILDTGRIPWEEENKMCFQATMALYVRKCKAAEAAASGHM